jgi:MoaA/NifB/PqqE/SkfB family radical SAM enzyme
MSLEDIQEILSQTKELGSLEWIYFEGGEPFLYYPVLLRGVREASRLGFKVGIVSNCYWATTVEDAFEWLRPFADVVQDLSISSDLYHSSNELSQHARNASLAAKKLLIPVGVISVAQPEEVSASPMGQLPYGKSAVMFRGRAAEKLAKKVPLAPWNQFTKCPHEKLQDPSRVHIDPFGNLHICQGIRIGNVHRKRLREICRRYDASKHPIVGPLLDGGPTELTRRYNFPHRQGYADACHLCYEARKALRSRFPEILGPDQIYGILPA